jgi:hypothetical protein
LYLSILADVPTWWWRWINVIMRATMWQLHWQGVDIGTWFVFVLNGVSVQTCSRFLESLLIKKWHYGTTITKIPNLLRFHNWVRYMHQLKILSVIKWKPSLTLRFISKFGACSFTDKTKSKTSLMEIVQMLFIMVFTSVLGHRKFIITVPDSN